MSDYTNWFVGMEVVCVDDMQDVTPPEDHGFLVAGKVYEIVEIELIPKGSWVYGGFAAKDIVFICLAGHPDAGFDAEGFRPVQKRKSDIAIFTRLLDNPRVRITEDA